MKIVIALLSLIVLLLAVGVWLYAGELRHQADLEQASKEAIMAAQMAQDEKDREAAAEAASQKQIDDQLAAQKQQETDIAEKAQEEQQREVDRDQEAEAQRRLEEAIADNVLQKGLNAATSEAEKDDLTAQHDKKVQEIEAKTADQLIADQTPSQTH